MTEAEIWAEHDYIDPEEDCTCMKCGSVFKPYAVVEEEHIESFWCKGCCESNDFLCFVLKTEESA